MPPEPPIWPRVVEAQPYMVYEAHSTDYQTPANLRALVQKHFAILKVGPGTDIRHARGALGAWMQVEREWLGADRSSRLPETVQHAMTAAPRYPGTNIICPTGRQLALDQQYSLSDRIRYYWPVPKSKRRCSACWRIWTRTRRRSLC